MIRRRVGDYASRVRDELRETFAGDHTTGEIAGSFALGTFVTMLPTLGTGLVVFVVVGYVSERISKLALLASVVVFNPAVKWGVYVASFGLGILLLGPVEGVGLADASLDSGPEVVSRLLVGNLILAVVATAGSYVIIHRLAVAYRASDIDDIVEEAVDDVSDELFET